MSINKQLWLIILFNLLAFISHPVMALTDQQKKMLDQLDQLDQLDHLDFIDQNEKANKCIFARDFDCAEKSIVKAAKSISNSQDKNELRITQQNLGKERQLKADEEKAEKERLLAEERRRERLERERIAQQEYEEEKRQHDANMKGLLAIAAGTYVGYSARNYSPEQQSRLVESAERSVMNGNSSELDSTSNQVISERQKQHNAQMQEIAEQNRRAAEAKREREQREAERNEREAERRRDAARERDGVQHLAEVREQNEADALKRRTEEELRAQQERAQKRKEEERHNQELRDSNERKRVADAEAAKKKAEAAAAKLAEQQAEKQAREQYLLAMQSGIRLGVKNCYGQYEVGGTKPKVKPEVVPCIDVHYRARCEGSAVNYDGVHKNFIGFDVGCFGDTATISPKPACPVNQLHVEVVEVRTCGG
jgi:hypothetical protein